VGDVAGEEMAVHGRVAGDVAVHAVVPARKIRMEHVFKLANGREEVSLGLCKIPLVSEVSFGRCGIG
jgi:hypothetical protein